MFLAKSYCDIGNSQSSSSTVAPDGEITTTFEYDGIQRLVKTPTERFHELVFRYPGIIHNLPIQEIAFYLGISHRQLHRIREAESGADASDSDDI